MKIIVFFINALVQLAAAAVGLFMLLVGLNGFGERQANPALLFYIVSSVVSAVGLGLASASAAQRLAQRSSFGALGGSLAAVLIFSVVGLLILAASLFASVIIAQAVRTMR